MKRIKAICTLICIFATITANNLIPNRHVEITDNGIIVTYQFYGGVYQQDPLYPNAKFWKIPGFGLNEESGKPSTLLRWDSFAIPNGATAFVEMIDCEYTDTIFTLAPARHALLNNDTIGYTLETVPVITAYTGFYPTEIVTLGNVMDYRGQGIQRVGVSPIQYDNTNGIVRNYSMIKYQVSFEWTDSDGEDLSTFKANCSDPMLNNLILNPSSGTSAVMNLSTTTGNTNSSSESNRDYLIVSTTEYEEAVKSFAEWKRTMGFKVHVVLNDNWTKEAVKSTVQDLYNRDDTNLYYLLIVGDIDDVPAYIGTYYSYSCFTDLPYGCMGGTSDYTPEISRGRIPVNSNEEATVVFNKIITYEQYPITDSNFYKKGVHCAYFQDHSPKDNYADRRFAQTSEEVRNYMLYVGKDVERIYYASPNVTPQYWSNGNYSFGEEIPSELQKPAFAWDGDYNDIKTAIDEGCFYVLQRDHGSSIGWGDPAFNINHVNTLNNGDKLPIIFSMSCQTGKFDSPSNCFAEAFLKKENGGCVGIIAASEISFSGYNDVLTETMFDAIWPDSILRIKMKTGTDNRMINPEPVYELGRILDLGLNYMDEVDPNIASISTHGCQYTHKLFHYFGDPSMMIRTEVPQEFSPSIKRADGVISVNTNCDGTRISFYTPSTNQVDSYVGQNISYSTTADSVIVCIDKHNYIPFIAHCDKNIYIQNDTINDERYYVGENILVGKNVTTQKAQGEVLIQNATVKLQGGEVTLHPGTTIVDSNMEINTK